MKTPFFSIVIPTFNSSAVIQFAIDSILNQTFSDFEILIIDGVSIDGTLEIVQNFNDSRIRIYSEPDKGIYHAMNKGIKLAKGEWLYFLGSDDSLYHETVLNKIQNYCINNNTQIVYGNIVSTRFNGVYAGEFDYNKLYQQNICHQSIFFHKSVFSTCGIFNLKYLSHADYDHNIRWFLNTKLKKLYIDEIIAEYADGGFSSQNGDLLFEKDKDFRFICSGFFSLPKSFLFELSKRETYNNQQYIVFTVLKIGLKIRRKI